MQKLIEWETRFNAMSPRERVLILVTVIVALAFPTFTYLIEPAQQETTKLRTSLQQLQAQSAESEVNYQLAKAAKIKDPNVALQQQVERLQAQVEQQRQQLTERTASLVTPHEMGAMLQQLLIGHQGVKLVHARKAAPVLVSTPVEPVAAGIATNASNTVVDAIASEIYRHELELVIEGSFFQVQGFLQAVEQANRSLFWDSFDYQVEGYPKARVQLKVYTLSTTQEWLGV